MCNFEISLNMKKIAAESLNFLSEVYVGHPIPRGRVFECLKRTSEESDYEP